MAIDATGEGSGLGDEIEDRYKHTYRFSSGSIAAIEDTYYDKWCEGLFELGKFFDNGGSISNQRLHEELLIAARTVKIDEKYYASREGSVFKATPKDDVTQALGRSPDLLDAAIMAAWIASDVRERGHQKQLLVW